MQRLDEEVINLQTLALSSLVALLKKFPECSIVGLFTLQHLCGGFEIVFVNSGNNLICSHYKLTKPINQTIESTK
jgi:hypothetical protein